MKLDEPPAAPAFFAAAALLGIAIVPERRSSYRARGVLDGREVELDLAGRARDQIIARVTTVPARDLRVEIFSAPPRHPYQRDVASRRGDFWLLGGGNHERALLLVEGAVGPLLHGLAPIDASIADGRIAGYLDTLDPDGATAAAQLRELLGLAAAIDQAAARVPVDPSAAWAGPRFAVAADALRLAFTTCPLGVRGVLDGCRISTHTLWMRSARHMFLHVELCRVIPGRWALRARGRSWWRRLHGAVRAMVGGGPGSGRFDFDRRFYVDGERSGAVRAVRDHLDALIEFVDRDWLSVQGDRVLVGFPLIPARVPDLTELLPRAVALAHQIGGPPATAVPSTPFR